MRSRDLFWLGSGIAVGFALAAAFPRLKKEFGPLVREAGTRAGELASEITAVVMDHVQRAQEGPVETPPADPAAS